MESEVVSQKSDGRTHTPIVENLEFHTKAPYTADRTEPIHRWCLIPESPSIRWADYLISSYCRDVHFLFDPFLGSGTVALAAMKHNMAFLGGDILPDMVLGSMAKLGAFSDRWETLTISLENILDGTRQRVQSYATTAVAAEELTAKLVFSEQEGILLSPHSSCTKLLALAALYQSIRDQALIASVRTWCSDYLSQLEYTLNDLRLPKAPVQHNRWRVRHGDACRMSWSDIAAELGVMGRPGALISSCTFVQSSQLQNYWAQLCADLGREALLALGIDAEDSGPTHASAPGDLLAHVRPGLELPAVDKYLITVGCALSAFRTVAASGSNVLLENENPVIGGEAIPVDEYICQMAHNVGYKPEQIVITHYLSTSKLQARNPSTFRGSIIHLSVV